MQMEKIKRIDFYDNLKFILIILVVVGHFIQFNINNGVDKGLFLFIYSFHIPLFVFVTGLFSKSIINGNSKRRLNKIISYLIIYVFYKLLIFVIVTLIFKQSYYISFFSEMEAPWYLLAVVLWIIITSALKDIKPKYLMFLSICCCLLIGYDSSITDQLCLSRVFVLFPFFLTGYYLSFDKMKDIITKLHKGKWKFWLALVLLFIIGFVFMYFGDELYFLRPLFTSRNPYVNFTLSFDIPFSAIILRFVWILYNVFMGILMFTLVPLGKTFYSKYGSRTLQVYVLHFAIAAVVGYSFISEIIISMFGNYSVLVFVLLGIVTTFILSINFLNKWFSKIMKIDYKWLYS